MATIKVRQNGSLLVDGEDVTLIDWNGNPYTIAKRPFALCRCGQSSNKPFCDGSHKTIGFQAAEAAMLPDAPADASAPAAPLAPVVTSSPEVPASPAAPAAETKPTDGNV